jgi:lipoate-protein ligase A
MTAAAKHFRVIDTGLRGARANIAFDQALIDAHQTGEITDTVRFLRFRPSVLVGRHQVLSKEIHRDYCEANGIEIARRITGGGAIYFDEGQLGWEIVCGRATFGNGNLGDIAALFCNAAAAGLRTLGIDARFRPRNDIEVGGRKLCGTGGFFDGDTIFYQGTLLIESDPALMFKALNVPAAKLEKRALDSAAQRIVTLKELLGDPLPATEALQAALLQGFEDKLGISADHAEPSPEEEARAHDLEREETRRGGDAVMRPGGGPGRNGVRASSPRRDGRHPDSRGAVQRRFFRRPAQDPVRS